MGDPQQPPDRPIGDIAKDVVASDAANTTGGRPGKQTGVALGGRTINLLSKPWVIGIAFAGGVTIAIIIGSRGGIGPFAPGAAATPPPTQALSQLLVIKALSATLNVPVTTYSVTAEDAGGGELSYSWAMTATSPDGMCGTPHVPWTRTGSVVPWSHLMLPPDNCPHVGTDHPVKAEVTITVLTGRDQGVTAVCDLFGSESQTITPPDSACHFSL